MSGNLTRTDRQIALLTGLAVIATGVLATAPTFVANGLTIGSAAGVLDSTAAAAVGVAMDISVYFVLASVASGGGLAAVATLVSV